ncbi:hypothetical protein MRX96_015330 [Rhipicephalus microplus]
MGFEPTWAEPIGLAVNRHNLSATLSTSRPIHAAYIIVSKTDHWENKKKLHDTTGMGFELTRAEHDDLAVHRLNLSATLYALQAIRAAYTLVSKTDHWENKKLRDSTMMGFEHRRAEPNGLAFHRTNL